MMSHFVPEEIGIFKLCSMNYLNEELPSAAERKCPPYIQYRGNITGGTEGEAKYKERIEVTCYLGYQFPDGTEVKRTRCGANYHWDPYLPLCERKVTQ